MEFKMKRKGNKDMHTFDVSADEEKPRKLDPEDSDEDEI